MELFKKIEYPRKIIKLKNGKEQEYFINSKMKWIAHTKKEKKVKKIYVSNQFDSLDNLKKEVILTHERGHLNFLLFGKFLNLNLIAQPSILVLILFGLLLIILNLIYGAIFNISNLLGLFSIFFGIIIFIQFKRLNWFNEIIADSNSVKLYGKDKVIQTLGEFYENKKVGFFNGRILHPPWNIRKKIIEDLD